MQILAVHDTSCLTIRISSGTCVPSRSCVESRMRGFYGGWRGTASGPCSLNEPNWVRVRRVLPGRRRNGRRAERWMDRHVSLWQFYQSFQRSRARRKASKTKEIINLFRCNSFRADSWRFILENFEFDLANYTARKIKDSIRWNEIPEIKWVEFSITLSLSRLASILSSKRYIFFLTINPVDATLKFREKPNRFPRRVAFANTMKIKSDRFFRRQTEGSCILVVVPRQKQKKGTDKIPEFNIKEIFKLSLFRPLLFTFVVSLPFSSVQKIVLVLDPPPQLALHMLHSPATHLEMWKESIQMLV